AQRREETEGVGRVEGGEGRTAEIQLRPELLTDVKICAQIDRNSREQRVETGVGDVLHGDACRRVAHLLCPRPCLLGRSEAVAGPHSSGNACRARSPMASPGGHGWKSVISSAGSPANGVVAAGGRLMLGGSV